MQLANFYASQTLSEPDCTYVRVARLALGDYKLLIQTEPPIVPVQCVLALPRIRN